MFKETAYLAGDFLYVGGVYPAGFRKCVGADFYYDSFGLAEITGNNPNVFYEAGLLKGLNRPVILLKKTGVEAQVPFDVFSDYRIEYELLKRGGRVKFAWLEEELDKIMQAVFKMSPELERAARWEA